MQLQSSRLMYQFEAPCQLKSVLNLPSIWPLMPLAPCVGHLARPPVPLMKVGWQQAVGVVRSTRYFEISRQRLPAIVCYAREPSNNAAHEHHREGRLLQIRLGPLQLLQQQLLVGQQVFKLITPEDVDDVVDLYNELGIVDSDPFWTRVWPSAVALADQILARPELVAGRKVADVGAGLGVAGMAAALSGAKEVVLLDREAMALQCALLSARATGLENIPSLDPQPLHASGPSVKSVGHESSESAAGGSSQPAASACQFSFSGPDLQRYSGTTGVSSSSNTSSTSTSISSGHNNSTEHSRACVEPQHQSEHPYNVNGDSSTEASSSNSTSSRGSSSNGSSSSSSSGSSRRDVTATTTKQSGLIRAHVFDWHQPELLAEQFDVILACDVLYDISAVEPLAAVVPRLLKPGGGSRLLLADPPNRSPKNRDVFLQLLQQPQQQHRQVSLVVEERSRQECEVRMFNVSGGGQGSYSSEVMPVQLMILREAVGNNTVGVKFMPQSAMPS